MHVERQDQSRQRDCPQVILRWAAWRRPHRCPRFGEEVLNDGLLDMAMLGVAVGNGAQRVDAVNLGLADADEDSSRKRNGKAASSVEGGQPTIWCLVRCSPVRRQVRPQGLDHHPLGGRNRSQRR